MLHREIEPRIAASTLDHVSELVLEDSAQDECVFSHGDILLCFYRDSRDGSVESAVRFRGQSAEDEISSHVAVQIDAQFSDTNETEKMRDDVARELIYASQIINFVLRNDHPEIKLRYFSEGYSAHYTRQFT